MIVDGRHALYCGWVAGVAAAHGVPLVPVRDDDGNWTDRLLLLGHSYYVNIEVIVPPPPEEWVPLPEEATGGG